MMTTAAEVAELRRRAAQAALDHLRGRGLDGVREEVARAATLQYEGYLSGPGGHRARPDTAGRRRRRTWPSSSAPVLRQATDVERALVLDARRSGRVSPASADEVLRDIEGQGAARLRMTPGTSTVEA